MSSSFIHIKKYGLVYARVPKVANSSIKTLLANMLGLKPVNGVKPKNDRFWRHHTDGAAEMLHRPEYTRRYTELYSFTFVREPLTHYLNNPVHQSQTTDAARAAMAITLFHCPLRPTFQHGVHFLVPQMNSSGTTHARRHCAV